MERVREIRDRDDLGPIVVFSAPTGYTDELIRIGGSYTQSRLSSVDSVFDTYERIAKIYVKGTYLRQLLSELVKYRKETDEALSSINKSFHGNAKAKVLTSGRELPTSVLMEHALLTEPFVR